MTSGVAMRVGSEDTGGQCFPKFNEYRYNIRAGGVLICERIHELESRTLPCKKQKVRGTEERANAAGSLKYNKAMMGHYIKMRTRRLGDKVQRGMEGRQGR